MNENQELPPLPEPDYEHPCGATYFTPDRMHAYARAALAAKAPAGWKLIAVNAAFDDLMYWLDRCDDKGHLKVSTATTIPLLSVAYIKVTVRTEGGALSEGNMCSCIEEVFGTGHGIQMYIFMQIICPMAC